jgi:hypothetical protein
MPVINSHAALYVPTRSLVATEGRLTKRASARAAGASARGVFDAPPKTACGVEIAASSPDLDVSYVRYGAGLPVAALGGDAVAARRARVPPFGCSRDIGRGFGKSSAAVRWPLEVDLRDQPRRSTAVVRATISATGSARRLAQMASPPSRALRCSTAIRVATARDLSMHGHTTCSTLRSL